MFSQLAQPAQPAFFTMVDAGSRRTAQAAGGHTAARTASWQQRAVAAYRQAEHRDVAAMQWELSDRIGALTEMDIAPESIYVNRAAQLAVVNVEGVVFQLHGHALSIVRPCVVCGTGHFESRALSTVHDLGFALGEWEPRCEHCAPADPENWLEIED